MPALQANSEFGPLASIYPLAYRLTHAIEIQHMGGGLTAALPDRRGVRRRAPARRGRGLRGPGEFRLNGG